MTDVEGTIHPRIAESLEHLAVPVGELQRHPTNPRRGNIEAIANSLLAFGQVRPIVVQASTGFIVAGNHTFRAATELLSWDRIAAVKVDLTDEDAERYLLADNRTADLGDYDNEVLAPLLEKLMLAGQLDGTGYDPDDVDDLLASMDSLPEAPEEEFEGGHSVSDEDLAQRFANRSQVTLRQFVLMYKAEVAEEYEGHVRALKRTWGMSGMPEVVMHALRLAVDQAPDAATTAEEAAVPEGAALPERSPAELAEDAYRYREQHNEPHTAEQEAQHQAAVEASVDAA